MTEIKTLSIPNPITALLNNYEMTIERLYIFNRLLPERDTKENDLYQLAEEYYKVLKHVSKELYKDFPVELLPVGEFLEEMYERLDDDEIQKLIKPFLE
ncbi:MULTISPECIES: hypothetical protein [Niallia]|uniref:hypothetical protein n=1 Tax=Niallia TaxID=2837506 RepID=UPI000FABBEAB|nr:hypothetical protein [Niallia circulans]MED5103363.1 hypothetical protein [Niallia circulans]QJX64098.1 hypothetical protein HLK66_22270 [Niallia circulans]